MDDETREKFKEVIDKMEEDLDEGRDSEASRRAHALSGMFIEYLLYGEID